MTPLTLHPAFRAARMQMLLLCAVVSASIPVLLRLPILQPRVVGQLEPAPGGRLKERAASTKSMV